MRKVSRRVYQLVRTGLAKALVKLRKADFGLLYINPNDVIYTISRYDLKGDSVWHFGTVSAGDWDLNGYPVREIGQLYSILKQRVVDKVDWEQIPEFVQHLDRIEKGALIDSCTTKEEYFDRWRKIEALYWTIREDGYKSQDELATNNPLDEIRIQIGREGELLLDQGRHRMVIAQLLNLDQVPVIVTRRHQGWDKKVE